MLARRTIAALPLLLCLLLTAACGTFAQSYDPAGVDGLTIPTPSPRAADFVSTVDNPWLPLTPGATLTYDVSRPGRPAATRTVAVLPGRVEIAGVPTTAVRNTLTGEGGGTSTDYYAQDERGNVWWFGHEAATGAWRAGRDGAQAGLAMAARPRGGDGYRTAYLPGVTEDVATVAQVEAGTLAIDVTSALTPGRVVREAYRRGTGLTARVDEATGEYDELSR